jgi:hypothetical protein
MTKQQLFELIERLTGTLPLSPERVGDVLGVSLQRDAEASGPSVEAYTSSDDRAFELVELRLSATDSGQQAGLLTVVPANGGEIDRKQIMDHYGLDFETQIPSPRYPREMPISMGYTMPWGRLSFGVSNDDAARLVRFVIKTT